MVHDVQVLRRWLVVRCHRNCLLELAIWTQLENSANLKGQRSAHTVVGAR